MKKVFILLFTLLLLIGSYLLYDEISFEPLSQVDFTNLFEDYHGKPKVICKKDFLGITSRGKFFEIYTYGLENVKVRSDYPQLTKWENNDITHETTVGKWTHCPIDKDVMNLYKLMLTYKDIGNTDCFHSFRSDIMDPRNFYSYIIISDTERYFFLYNSERKILYYIRRRGI